MRYIPQTKPTPKSQNDDNNNDDNKIDSSSSSENKPTKRWKPKVAQSSSSSAAAAAAAATSIPQTPGSFAPPKRSWAGQARDPNAINSLNSNNSAVASKNNTSATASASASASASSGPPQSKSATTTETQTETFPKPSQTKNIFTSNQNQQQSQTFPKPSQSKKSFNVPSSATTLTSKSTSPKPTIGKSTEASSNNDTQQQQQQQQESFPKPSQTNTIGSSALNTQQQTNETFPKPSQTRKSFSVSSPTPSLSSKPKVSSLATQQEEEIGESFPKPSQSKNFGSSFSSLSSTAQQDAESSQETFPKPSQTRKSFSISSPTPSLSSKPKVSGFSKQQDDLQESFPKPSQSKNFGSSFSSLSSTTQQESFPKPSQSRKSFTVSSNTSAQQQQQQPQDSAESFPKPSQSKAIGSSSSSTTTTQQESFPKPSQSKALFGRPASKRDFSSRASLITPGNFVPPKKSSANTAFNLAASATSSSSTSTTNNRKPSNAGPSLTSHFSKTTDAIPTSYKKKFSSGGSVQSMPARVFSGKSRYVSSASSVMSDDTGLDVNTNEVDDDDDDDAEFDACSDDGDSVALFSVASSVRPSLPITSRGVSNTTSQSERFTALKPPAVTIATEESDNVSLPGSVGGSVAGSIVSKTSSASQFWQKQQQSKRTFPSGGSSNHGLSSKASTHSVGSWDGDDQSVSSSVVRHHYDKFTPSDTRVLRHASSDMNSVDSNDIDNGDNELRFALFAEKTEMHWHPELDREAQEVYRDAWDTNEPRGPFCIFPKLPPKTSGYGWKQIFLEEDEPPECPSKGGWYANFMARRRKQLKWEAHMRKLGEKAAIIQALGRRFCARILYHKLCRLRMMERWKKRMKEISKIIIQIEKDTKEVIKEMRFEFLNQRDKERDAILKTFKQEGRRQLKEAEKMVASKPQLEQEQRDLKATSIELANDIKRVTAQTKKIEETTVKLELVSSKYQELVEEKKQELQKQQQECAIESALRNVYENGLTRVVQKIEAALAAKGGDPRLFLYLQKLVQDCQEEITDSNNNNKKK